MEKLIQQFLENQYPKTEISVGYVKGNDVFFKGMLKTETDIIEVDNSNRLFEIGSITKVFTTNILAQLIQEKKVNGTDLISTILPQKNLKKSPINLINLANHTAGLPRLPDNFYTIPQYDEKNPYLNYDEKALNDYLENQFSPLSEAGKKFDYSNLGSGILSYAIGIIENMPFQEVVKKRIFSPLKMTASSFERNNKKNSVLGLNKTGKPSDFWKGGLLSGCIGIVSSTKDMTKFMLNILDNTNEVANLQLTPTYEIDANYHIGLGWGIRTLADKSQSYNHGGGSDGYSCYMKLHRKTQRGFIILTNISAFNPHQSQLNELVNQLDDFII